ncbi:Crp/Fnr family transcriptional regulator [Streptomyces sp. NPDC020412]|uniref:Crp/Fnr family transcriptional regulator n=1 Tax=Streptomyces sp. NPDC020412 TaxID=3365073 RepID=UPI00378B9C72
MSGTAPYRGGNDRRAGGEWTWPRSSLLGSLAPSARSRLLALGTRVGYEAGRVLMREGDETAFVLLLVDGVVKATGRTRDGRDALLAVRMGGELVGELAAVDGKPRSATVTTCGIVTARVLDRKGFLSFLDREPAIAHAVNASIVAKLRAANSYRVDFTGCDAPTRLARVLYQVALSHGEHSGDGIVIRWPITQPELGTLSGAAEPTVQKALRRLREAGAISTGYRAIKVEDLARLNAIANDQP